MSSTITRNPLDIPVSLDRVETGSGIGLRCYRRSFLATDEADLLAGRHVRAQAAYFSQDGHPWAEEWHVGADDGDTVYVERWTTEGLAFHGWVHAQSRRIVQAG